MIGDVLKKRTCEGLHLGISYPETNPSRRLTSQCEDCKLKQNRNSEYMVSMRLNEEHLNAWHHETFEFLKRIIRKNLLALWHHVEISSKTEMLNTTWVF